MAKPISFFLATRPSFLVITLLGCSIGLLLPNISRENWTTNLLGIALVLMVHASANLLNDYFDHLNGSDACNYKRISPFTGGSRFIQNKVLSPAQIFSVALILILISVTIGIYICSKTTWNLVSIGFLGVFIAWTYSAPPLQLMSKGILGELAITVAWSLVVIGFASMQLNQMAYGAIPVGIAYGLMVANILLVNQVPDIEADRIAKKYTLATICSPHELRVWYSGIFITAYVFQLTAIYFFEIPKETGITVFVLPIFLICSKQLSKPALTKEQTKALIVRNLIAAHLYPLFLCIGLYFS